MGISALHEFVPDSIPSLGNRLFVDSIEELPDIRKFGAMLAKLHQESMASPEAPQEFGFPVVTYEGTMYQDVTWCKDWEQSSKLHMWAFIDQEMISRGPSQELDELLPHFKEKVIPRLLRPLQTHGRSIKPFLLHGDLWYGNMAIKVDTGTPIFF